MCGLKVSDHDKDSIVDESTEWSVQKCTKDYGYTDAFGEMYFSPSGNSSKVGNVYHQYGFFINFTHCGIT